MPKYLYPNHTYPIYAKGTAYMQSGNITHTLLKTIDTYSGPFYFNDDMLITGIIAEKAGIARHKTALIRWTDCNQVCLLFQTPIIYQCRHKNEILNVWSKWKNTSFVNCKKSTQMTTQTTKKTSTDLQIRCYSVLDNNFSAIDSKDIPNKGHISRWSDPDSL